ncbi:MAG TPA: methionyl-tRNA formyltransferase [Candidatus Dormibacteraeota bacterium]|nr:methionyl-tRNA formyltransferase [Candidatus Dormibacteraeota bacterium]
MFFGTPAFAVPSLEALLAYHDVPLVVTQPDRPAGRGLELRPSPVALRADAAGALVVKPARARDPELAARVAAARPDVVVVTAYGQILPRALLDIAPHRAVNVHASLLPRWRGASPITAAVLAGDTTTGISIMKMDEGLDTGPIILQKSTSIFDSDDSVTLGSRLSLLGAEALVQALEAVAASTATYRPQDDVGMTYAPLVKKSDGDLEWTLRAVEIERALRAYRPWPGVRLPVGDTSVEVVAGRPLPDWWFAEDGGGTHQALPGTVLKVIDQSDAAGIVVQTSSGPFLVQRLKPPGKREMSAVEFARGHRGLLARP